MKNTIGARIAEQRKQKGMTQEALAETLGVSAQADSKWENDVSCPDISLLPALAEKLEISLDELLGGKKAEERVRITPAPQRSVEELNLMIRMQSADGDRVKVTVRFRGREMAHTNLGEKLLIDFSDACAEIASMEKNPKLEGRFMAMFLTPKNSK
mgnify:CR=1 FL=1